MDVRQYELKDAITFCYGEVPKDWVNRLGELLDKLETLPPLSNGQPMPFITYFLYQLGRLDAVQRIYINSIKCQAAFDSFCKDCQGFEEAASVEATVSEKNFKSEVEAFGDIQKAISNPHLDISYIYRYIAAVQQSYSSLITDEIYNQARRSIMLNPYRFFAYGEDNIQFMPMLWQEVYFA